MIAPDMDLAGKSTMTRTKSINRAPVAQLVEHRAVTPEVMSSTPAGPTLRS